MWAFGGLGNGRGGDNEEGRHRERQEQWLGRVDNEAVDTELSVVH